MAKYMKYPKWRNNPEAPTATMAVSNGECRTLHYYDGNGRCICCGKTEEEEVRDDSPAATR